MLKNMKNEKWKKKKKCLKKITKNIYKGKQLYK